MNELVQPRRGRRYEPHPPEVYERAREMIAGGMSHRQVSAAFRAEGILVSASYLSRRVPVKGLRFSRKRRAGTLSAWHLGKLKRSYGWALHSKQWRLAKALELHVGHLADAHELDSLSGFTHQGCRSRMQKWRKAGVLSATSILRGPQRGLLSVHSIDLEAIEFPPRDQMIVDVLGAMKRAGEALTAYAIAKLSGWSEHSVRVLLAEMQHEGVVFEVESDRPGVRLFALPGGWVGGAS